VSVPIAPADESVRSSADTSATGHEPARHGSTLYIQVLVAIALGILLGLLRPDYAVAMKPLGDGFIKLIKMLIGPIVFATIVTGIAQTGAMKHVGRIGLRALLYFEVVSTLALVIGLIVVRTLQPGVGASLTPTAAEQATVSSYAAASKNLSTTQFLLNIIPDSMVSAFVGGEILQVLLVSILFGLALLALGPSGAPMLAFLTTLSNVLFRMVGLVMRLAPIGAFGAMAYTIGNHGIEALWALGKLLVAVYVTCALFVFVVLNAIAAYVGFSLFKLLRYIGEELLIVLGTSSSESALPRLMTKLERLGCSPTVVGLVVPTGYSFNLDGTSIYMTMAAIFVAQISGVHLTLSQELGHPRAADSDFEGCGGGDGVGLHHPCRHAVGLSGDSGGRAGPAARCRPLHVRGTRHHQSGWQCRGDDGDCEVGWGIGYPACPSDSRREGYRSSAG
jgi:aerobic C4-dicarboxylate transport protein